MSQPRSPTLATDDNQCPHCFQHLPIKYAKSGINAGHNYLVCLSCTPKWWYFFPKQPLSNTLSLSPRFLSSYNFTPDTTLPGSSQPLPSMAIATSNHATTDLTPPTPALLATQVPFRPSSMLFQPSSTPFQPSSTQSGQRQCAAPLCNKQKVNRDCLRQMCKPHCVNNGGCVAIGHRWESLTQRQKEKSTHVTDTTVYHPTSTASSSIDPELEYRATTPPSTQAPAFTPSLAPTPSFAPSTTPEPARSLIVPPPIAVGLQVNPKMTRQMSSLWMDHYSGSQSTASLKERVKGGRSAQTDIALSHRFLLIYWDNSEQPASIRVVQGGDDWPKWNLVADPTVHASLASSAPLEAIDMYEFKYSTWAQVPLDYRFVVKTDADIASNRTIV